MAVRMRFHGRFVYARRPDKSLTALATVFERQRFNEHHVSMSIAHDDIKFFNKDDDDGDEPAREQLTTANPTLRIASPAHVRNPQILIWDLKDTQVSYESASTASEIGGPAQVVALADLEALRKVSAPKLKEAALTPKGGLTRAAISLTGATGVGTTPLTTSAKFVRGGDAAKAAKGDPAIMGNPLVAARRGDNMVFRQLVAESIDFSVPTMPGLEGPLLKLELKKGGKTVGFVALKDNAEVTFSNLCSPLSEPRDSDLEFAQYYDLVDPSPGDDGLVPHVGGGLSEGVCCVCAARA